jgi:Zn-dependent protease with chaperone function
MSTIDLTRDSTQDLTRDLYPAGPSNVSADLTKPTSAYKQRAWWAVASLALFVVLYIALASWFVWTAYRLYSEAMRGGTGVLFNYFIGTCAAFLAIFMLKALVFVKKGSTANDVEVTQADQPRLFAFLYRLADEAGAPRPTRVFLSARVNAAVFYDLSVINLIFPSKKNLEIGLSLVNVLSLSETKAVLAHEFGHFAQRSMAIGSWVYIAQQIAEHVIAKRDKLDGFLQGLSSTDFRIAWIGWLLSLIVWSIRSLLDTILRLVVLAQRALSRQMEFQADLVAVSLTGSDELIHALHKLQAADEAWERTLSFANSELRAERMPHDLFAVQTQIIKKMAHIFDDEDYGKVPKFEGSMPAAHRVFKTSFAQPPQMWSTHPASSDREENAKKTYLPAPHDDRSAWLLFDKVEELKAKVVSNFVGEIKAEPATAEKTMHELDAFYNLPQLDPRYRGAYLGRTLTRHATRPEQLYESPFTNADVKTAINNLYGESLGDNLEKLRELEEEKGILQALLKKVYQATGGKIVFRGREISRRDLPEAIAEVSTEETAARQQILDHDKTCRSAHLAAAQQLGGNWHGYLTGLIGLLHYTEHSLADLRDAQGLLSNVVAVVMADGKVSAKELKQLITTANSLHGVLSTIYTQKDAVKLDQVVLAKLDTPKEKAVSWSAMLEEFTLPPASNDNINDWMRAIDSWVNSAADALAATNRVALETLISSEDNIAKQLRAGTKPEEAPYPSQTPASYATLISGQERKRQEKLGPWDSFMTADGMIASIARLLVAGSIVGAVLGFSGMAASTSTISIYNGLSRDVTVRMGKVNVDVPAYNAREIEIELDEKSIVEAKTIENDLIESFTPALNGHSQHYIYNVAGASPLVEWAAVYGSDPKQDPRFLGAARWSTSNVDVFFSEPPESVSTKSGGATKWVIDGAGNRPPDEIMNALPNENDKKQVAQAHAKWDKPSAENTAKWQELAK